MTATLGPGDYFGETGFLTSDDRDGDAIADGVVTVDFLRRNEFLALLSLNPEWVAPAIARAFDLADNALPPDEPAEPVNGVDGPSPSAPEQARLTTAIVLIRNGKRVQAVVGTHENRIGRLLFRIGRSATGEGKDTYFVFNLALDDKRPFNLSRRHFAIEELDGWLIVRDCGSYHGTTLNAMILGGKARFALPLPHHRRLDGRIVT